jgi:hypothetical protein
VSAEHTVCIDCGVQAWRFREDGRRLVHEDFYVSAAVWNATCLERGVLCIGCFERRLGRRLYRDDFTHPPRTHTAPWPGPGTLPSTRFVDRWANVRFEQLTLGVPAA